jgi:hypothetical protein
MGSDDFIICNFKILYQSLQCTSRLPSYFNNTGGTSKGIMTSFLPLKRPTDYFFFFNYLLELTALRQITTVEQKRTVSQFHYIARICATTYIISQLVSAFTARNMFFFNCKSEEPLKKNSKPAFTLLRSRFNHTRQQKLYPSGDPVPLTRGYLNFGLMLSTEETGSTMTHTRTSHILKSSPASFS